MALKTGNIFIDNLIPVIVKACREINMDMMFTKIHGSQL